MSIRIISLEDREDRRIDCAKELSEIGLTPDDYQFFRARHVPEFGARGCALSHAQALADFLYSEEKPFLLIFEDDFCIREKSTFRQSVLDGLRLAPLWDVFLLAHADSVPIERTQLTNVYRAVHARTASGYIVGRLYASKLIDTCFRSAKLLRRTESLLPPNRELARIAFSCDILWKELQTQDRFWLTHPSLTFRRPSFSDIEQREVAYGI